jgi:hypothetical protein
MSYLRQHFARQHWRWLVLPLLALLPLCAQAQGTIVHRQLSTPNPDPNFPWDFQGLRLLSGFDPIYYDMDLNGDGSPEYRFGSANASLGGFSIQGASGAAVLSHRSLNAAFVVPLDSLSPIGADPGGFDWTRHGSPSDGLVPSSTFTACVDIGCIGLFTGLESAYAGLQFQIDGQTHYGWARVGAPLGGLNGGWIYEYAYDTRPGVPILAGAVPEPSTWALLGLGGLLFWWYGRRKKRANKSAGANSRPASQFESQGLQRRVSVCGGHGRYHGGAAVAQLGR